MNVYNAIWRKLKELRPDSLQQVQSVMSDYERAVMTIAREIFPNSRLTGCWFHFNQVRIKLMGAETKYLVDLKTFSNLFVC